MSETGVQRGTEAADWLRLVIPEPATREMFTRYRDGGQSAEMTVMYWLKALPDTVLMRARLAAVRDRCNLRDDGEASARAAAALMALVDANIDGCERIAQMLRSGVDSDCPAPSVEEGLDFCRKLFEWSVQQSPASSVALYSLGNPSILESATREIVDALRGYGSAGRRLRRT